jgi:diguanylate cyclase (GGDEF)-like protein
VTLALDAVPGVGVRCSQGGAGVRENVVSLPTASAPEVAGQTRFQPLALRQVLVIDDSPGHAALVRQMLLESLGSAVLVVHRETLQRALSVLGGRTPIDCVLLDLSLPDASGLEALEAIASAAPEVPVVVLTGTEDASLALRAVQAGAQDYLPKRGTDAPLLARAMRYAAERKRSELRIAHDALHDRLTGLPNRTLFLDRLAVALQRAPRRPGSVAVLFTDLDRFKAVNDSFGHEAGDELLIAVADRLRTGLRAGDTVARPGSDEFLLLCDDLGSEREALVLAHRARELIAEPIELRGRELSIGACVGVAVAERAESSPESLIRDADHAIRQAKRRGSGVELFEAAMHVQALVELETEHRLRHAVERGELRLHYQPEVAVSDGSAFAVEALMRWEHPERGLLAPRQFIGLAEETGLIVPIGEWVIGEACRALAHWRHWRNVSADLSVSVNVSPRQLSAPGLTEAVRMALASSGIPPGRLCLEVTETSVAQDPGRAGAVLGELKRLGVRIALDDFGTGYSSLSALSRYPVDIVKIDRSFISQASTDIAARRMFVAILALVRAAGLDAVVEGVEVPAQLELLRRAGCHAAQGYLFARPAPEDVMLPMLGTRPARAAPPSGR